MNKVLLVIFLFFSLIHLFSFFNYSLTILQYPYVWALTENENMLFIHGIISVEPVYQLKNVDVFSYFVYPPFFYFISALLVKIFGFSIFIPRLLSLLSFFALCLVIWLFFKEQKKWFDNILITFILISSSVAIGFYSQYFILARVDMFSVALAFFSSFFLWKLFSSPKKKRSDFIPAGGLAIAAIFTKQSIFFPYFLIALLLFFVKDRRQWLLFGAITGLMTGVCLFVMYAMTNGEFVKSLQLASEVYGKYLISLNHFLWLQNSFIEHYIGLLLGVLFLFILSIRWIIKKKQPAFSVVLFIAVYLNFLITGGNSGAAYNTMIPVIFCCLIVIKEVYFFKKNTSIEKYGKVIFFFIIGLQLLIYRQFNFPYDIPKKSDRQNQEALVKIIQTSKKEWILGDRIDYAIFLAGKESPLEASTHNVAREWKNTKQYALSVEKNLNERINNHEIDLAVVGITKFGRGNLLSTISSQGKVLQKLNINYLDSKNLEHTIYKLDEK